MRRGLTPSRFYPDEAELSELILGPGRVCEWKALALVFEREGLPPIDKMTGGRFWPAVEKFFQNRHGLITIQPGALGPQDGGEQCIQPRRPKRRPDSQPAPGATVHQFRTGLPDATS